MEVYRDQWRKRIQDWADMQQGPLNLLECSDLVIMLKSVEVTLVCGGG